MKHIYLLGSPVAHSISPQIHNRIFEAMGLPYEYTAMDVPPADLRAAIQTLRDGMAGANVTIPHKEAAAGYCDEVSELSMATGTVNTLYVRDGRLCGTTTDPAGFYRALEETGHAFGGDDVVILGNGGTARTLAAAILLDKKCKSLTISARSAEKAEALALSLKDIRGTIPVASCASPLSENVAACVNRLYDYSSIFERCSLLINCTSAGMSPNTDTTPIDKKYFHKGMTVFDVIYNPSRTRFLTEAREAGCKTKNGLMMLLYQGLESFKYWTGADAPADLFDEEQLLALIDNIRKDTKI